MGGKNPFSKGTTAPSVSAAAPPATLPALPPPSAPSFVPIVPKVAPCPIQYILYGPPVAPEQHIRGYSEDEFESFVREWAFYYKQIRLKTYKQVGRFGGAGDMGRDVVGYIDPPSSGGRLDIYQCKHYGHGLQPGEVWIELGKLCYYTFVGAFSVPDEYRFVCPEDVGPALGRLLEKPDELRQGLIDEWEKSVEGEIIKKQKIKLEGALLDHVTAFDFKRVGYKPIHEIVQEFRDTPRYPPRFGGGLIIRRSPDKKPPAAIESEEQRYVDQLLSAYGDHKSCAVTLADLPAHTELLTHFERSRVRYFCAETLQHDVRDGLPEGVTFAQIQDQVLDAVSDVCEDAAHASGYARVNAVTNHAGNYTVQDHPLKDYLNSQILKGVCHQLANKDKLTWVPT